jgi:glycosyltransferase involved in cell wall biosynthesis
MRITFICPTVSFAGGVKVVSIYAQQLQRMGHTVCVISVPPAAMTFNQKLKSWLKGDGWAKELAPRASHLDGAELDHCILDRARAVTDDDVADGDVVIATWWETAEWVAALSANKGAKVYFIQHHEVVFDHLPGPRIQATYQLPLHKIVIAQWLKRVMSELYGDDIVDIVPNSVDRSQFFAPVRGKQFHPTVGFLYSNAHFKGLDAILAALRIVREHLHDLRMISFGGECPGQGLALAKGTEFFHLPPQDEIRNLYARCDVWLTASRSEGFNLPALEAMACRTPVVSTRTGWPEEAIKSGWNGVLVDIDDVRGLARGVEWVLSRSEEEWRSMSANAFATASAGSWEESARMLEKALEHARRRAAKGELGPIVARQSG